MNNLDKYTVDGFGLEWAAFDQSELSDAERLFMFEKYFRIFPWTQLPAAAVGADIGCGSGRWASVVAPRVGTLHCVDPSGKALSVAQRNLARLGNVQFHQATVDAMPFPDASLDFAYSLGVLHHVPDTAAAIRSVAAKLKPRAPFLVYLYYAFDNRPAWYRFLWRVSDWIRRVVARMPFRMRYVFSQIVAVTVYWPLARAGHVLERLGHLPQSWPLAFYKDTTFYTMRTDALDRFGTRLEHRFTKAQITVMLQAAGFVEIRFSETTPFWCAAAVRR